MSRNLITSWTWPRFTVFTVDLEAGLIDHPMEVGFVDLWSRLAMGLDQRRTHHQLHTRLQTDILKRYVGPGSTAFEAS